MIKFFYSSIHKIFQHNEPGYDDFIAACMLKCEKKRRPHRLLGSLSSDGETTKLTGEFAENHENNVETPNLKTTGRTETD